MVNEYTGNQTWCQNLSEASLSKRVYMKSLGYVISGILKGQTLQANNVLESYIKLPQSNACSELWILLPRTETHDITFEIMTYCLFHSLWTYHIRMTHVFIHAHKTNAHSNNENLKLQHSRSKTFRHILVHFIFLYSTNNSNILFQFCRNKLCLERVENDKPYKQR